MIIKHLSHSQQLKLYLKTIFTIIDWMMPWVFISQKLVAWKRGGSLLSTSKFVSRPVFFTFGWLIMGENITGCYSPDTQVRPVRDHRYPEQIRQNPRRTLHLSSTGLIWCFTRKLLLFLLECWWWCETTRTSLQFNSLLCINVTINWIQWDNICNLCRACTLSQGGMRLMW